MMASASRHRFLAAAALAAGLVAMLPSAARGAPLVADLSEHLIKITTGFAGSRLLLFGATDGPGDVIVVVRGPRHTTIVRRKIRIAGIWVHGAEVRFEGVPAFYAVASSAPLTRLLGPQDLAREQIGAAALELRPRTEMIDDASLAGFRTALVRNRQHEGLFQPGVGAVNFLGEQLFRAEIDFPANVPTGTYEVRILLVRDGNVVQVQTTPLFVSKVGLSAEIFDFAQERSALYGLIAIAIALIAGWLASAIFQRI